MKVFYFGIPGVFTIFTMRGKEKFEFIKYSIMIRRDGPVVQKSMMFAISVVKFCDFLNEGKKYIISNQLLKAGTSIGANVFEAQYAESRVDFIHK